MANTERLLFGIANAVIFCNKTSEIVGKAMLNLSPKENHRNKAFDKHESDYSF
jgi:hypothetical protein